VDRPSIVSANALISVSELPLQKFSPQMLARQSAKSELQSLAQVSVSANSSNSTASNSSIHVASGYIMTASDALTHVGPVPLVSWTDLRSSSFGCTDGRATEETLSTWGGDIGEFITAINVYEQMSSMILSQADTTTILRNYLIASPRKKFTTCMTSEVLTRLFGDAPNAQEQILHPEEENRAGLWLKIADPKFIGNEHLQFMLLQPYFYSVRQELVENVIHSFFDILWNPFDPLRDKLHVQILNGNHAESGIVTATVAPFCLEDVNVAPVFTAQQDTLSVAYVNADAVQYLRKELSAFFGRDATPVVSPDDMNKRLNVLATGQSYLTIERLYSSVPQFSAYISA